MAGYPKPPSLVLPPGATNKTEEVYPVVVKHSTNDDELTISVPAGATIRDVKKGMLEKLGWGKMSQVDLFLKSGNVFAKHFDDKLVWTANEQRWMKSGKKVKPKLLYATGVSFTEAPSELDNEAAHFEPASPKRRAKRMDPWSGEYSGSPSPLGPSPAHSPKRSLSPMSDRGGSPRKPRRKRIGQVVAPVNVNDEPDFGAPQPLDAMEVFDALEQLASPRPSPPSSPIHSPCHSPRRAGWRGLSTPPKVESPDDAFQRQDSINSEKEVQADVKQSQLRTLGGSAEDIVSDSFRIALMTNGTRGDVQPMIALALTLETFRHTVSLFLPHNLMDLCKGHAVDAVPVFGNNQVSMRLAGGLGGLSDVENVTNHHQFLRKSKEELEKWLRQHPSACIAVDDALEDFRPHVIVLGCLCDGPAFRYQKKFGVPVVPLLLTHKDLQSRTYKNLQPPRPILYAVSEEVDPKPLEEGPWPKRTGPLVLRQKPPTGLDDLHKFVMAGPPIVMGWGSMQPASMTPTQMLGLALRTLKEGNFRGVILGGWAALHELGQQLLEDRFLDGLGSSEECEELAAFAKERVFFIESAPHDWLLPKCMCLVHHGGAGTVQSALRAGCPQVVTPIWHDQFESAQRVEEMRLGIGFTKHRFNEISVDELTYAVMSALRGREFAAHTAANLADERGDRRAASIIDVFLKLEVATGQWNSMLQSQQPRFF